MSNNKELIISNQSSFLQVANFNMPETIAEELAGLDLTFDRIKIPSGGGAAGTGPAPGRDRGAESDSRSARSAPSARGLRAYR